MEKFKRVKSVFTYTIFVLPALAVYFGIIAFPIISSFGLSFTDFNIYKNIAVWTGLANYIKIFKDHVFWISLRNNFFIMFVSVFGQIPLGFGLAYVIHRRLVKHSEFFQTMVFLPMVISSIIVGVLWGKMFSPIGVIPEIIRAITNNPDYSMTIMISKNLVLIPIGFVFLWRYTGAYMIIFLFNMQSIDPDIIEAASIDGATEGQIFRKIIVPQLYGVVVITLILAISGSLKCFDLLFAMTGGGPAYYTNILSIYMYNQSFVFYNYGVGSAVSVVMVIISIILVVVARFARKKVDVMEA